MNYKVLTYSSPFLIIHYSLCRGASCKSNISFGINSRSWKDVLKFELKIIQIYSFIIYTWVFVSLIVNSCELASQHESPIYTLVLRARAKWPKAKDQVYICILSIFSSACLFFARVCKCTFSAEAMNFGFKVQLENLVHSKKKILHICCFIY